MTQKELLKTVAGWLNEAGVKYMVTGAWSVIFHGRIRTSHDLDFVVDVNQHGAEKLKKIFGGSEDFMVQPEAVDEAVGVRGMFQVAYWLSGDKIDFWLVKEDEFDKLRFSRRVAVLAWGEKIYVASPEDTILQKLKWYKMSKIEKHLIDAAFVWQLQSKMDKKYISGWAKRLGVEKYLKKLDKVNLEDHY